MRLGLKGKRALVTGGARGIGLAVTRLLVSEGCEVSITTRDYDLGRRVGTEMGIGRVYITELKDFDPPSVDILVNNAGSTLGIKDPLCPVSDYQALLELNFLTTVRLSNALIPHMKEKGWGRIVNIASDSGIENRGPVTFCCAKAALVAYTKSMGRVLANDSPGVVMSGVLPGIVMTEDGHWAKASEEHKDKYLEREAALKRFGNPEEIATQIVLQCSELASFYHGCIVPVDAGLSKRFG